MLPTPAIHRHDPCIHCDIDNIKITLNKFNNGWTPNTTDGNATYTKYISKHLPILPKYRMYLSICPCESCTYLLSHEISDSRTPTPNDEPQNIHDTMSCKQQYVSALQNYPDETKGKLRIIYYKTKHLPTTSFETPKMETITT